MIAFFARNDIATNILMVAILALAGWVAMEKIPVEVRPAQEYREVRVSIPYRGGSPADVERDVAIPVEQALEGLAGVKEVHSEVSRGNCRVFVLAEENANLKDLLDDVKARVDRVSTLPGETERPRYEIPSSNRRREVITVAAMGELSDRDLLDLARRVRDEISQLKNVTFTEVKDVAPVEISVEADPERLNHFGLSLTDLTNAIRRSSIDLPAGAIRSPNGSITLRTTGQAYTREEFEKIPVRSEAGAEVLLGEVANVIDGFEQDRKISRLNGKKALFIEVMRTEDQNAIEIADEVKAYVARTNETLPSGISLAVWDDETLRLRGRLDTLINSLVQGAFLVLLVLGLFLRPAVAFWILIGIPVAFAGGLIFMPAYNGTINLMSLFGFIIVLGIVVDDAIVTGENIYTKLRDGMKPEQAAIQGTKEVATPVTFGIITTIVAFVPLMFMPDTWKPFVSPILPVVAPVLLFSLIESKLILPAHLKHIKTNRPDDQLGTFGRFQRTFSRGLEAFVHRVFQPLLNISLKHRFTTLSVFAAMAMLLWGYWKGGHLGFVNLPSVDRDIMVAWLEMPDDTPVEATQERFDKLYNATLQLQKEYTDPATGESIIGNITDTVGGRRGRGGFNARVAMLAMEMSPPEKRPKQFANLKNAVFEERLRELFGPTDDLRRFSIRSERGGGRDGDQNERSITLRVFGPQSDEKRRVLDEIETLADSFKADGVTSTYHNFREGSEEIQLTLKPRATELGFTQRALASQVRASFFGEQAQRIQRNRDDLRVMVRLPREDRESLNTLSNLILRTPNGTAIPFSSVAEATLTKSPNSLKRINGAQVNDFYAEVRDDEVPVMRIAKEMEPEIDRILSQTEFTWAWTGFVEDDGETAKRTKFGFIMLLFTLYALLAIPFKSLVQPIFVLIAVPFGVVGAALGHIILGQTPSWLSVFGILALSGVVVNDSLVLVDFINRKRAAGVALYDAVLSAGAARFRPILLTSLTTFAGLFPLIMERSLQAQFLKPMAISLAFGILFATVITLFLIPAAYLATEDLKALAAKFWKWYRQPFAKSSPPSQPAAES